MVEQLICGKRVAFDYRFSVHDMIEDYIVFRFATNMMVG